MNEFIITLEKDYSNTANLIIILILALTAFTVGLAVVLIGNATYSDGLEAIGYVVIFIDFVVLLFVFTIDCFRPSQREMIEEKLSETTGFEVRYVEGNYIGYSDDNAQMIYEVTNLGAKDREQFLVKAKEIPNVVCFRKEGCDRLPPIAEPS